ncbi:MAG: RagB/SusD family nutrient uptake outer membrane protein [Dysgonomonas sp.]|nr:RagB/SusD family nutrient uptake outer membrane protein [Dysgonomonas sp.]
MKQNILKSLFGAGILLLICGCSNFLDQPILGENVDTPAYYDDEDNANMAVIACYDALQYDDDISSYQWMFADVASDDAWKGGGGEAESPYIQDMKDWVALPTNIWVKAVWQSYYMAIFRSNTVIQRMEGVTFSEDLKKQYIAEAKFVRAYSYLILVKLFGDVPLFTEPVKTDDIGTAQRAPFEDVIAQIKKDFSEAAAELPGSWPADQVGRATSGAAKGFEARTIMYAIGMFKTETSWQRVYDLTDEIVKSGNYSLYPNYAEIFEDEGENCSESLFEIQHKTTYSGWTTENEGANSPIVVANRGTDDNPSWGWGYNCPTQDLVDEFESQDPRLYTTVHGRGITDYVYGIKHDVATFPYLTGYCARKLATDPALRGPNQSDYPNNLRMLRYADILLMRAEAAYHLSKEDIARQSVNQVRTRARQSTYPKGYNAGTNTYVQTGFIGNLPDITVSGDALLTAIKHERRVELAMEMLRYWDQVRWGEYRASLSPKVQANYDRHLLRGVPVLPIPNDEVVAWGLEQNPNY